MKTCSDRFPWRLFGRMKIVNGAGDLYLVRYWLVRCPWFSIALHHILRDDEDRDLHDHPFSFISILLWGGYLEARNRIIVDEKGPQVDVIPNELHRAPAVLFRRDIDQHRLTLLRPTWTLVFTGPKHRRWGFQTNQGWVDADQYQELFNDRPTGENAGGAGVAAAARALASRVDSYSGR